MFGGFPFFYCPEIRVVSVLFESKSAVKNGKDCTNFRNNGSETLVFLFTEANQFSKGCTCKGDFAKTFLEPGGPGGVTE